MSATAQSIAMPNSPLQIGRFTVQSKLGQGSQGVVYLAEDSQLHREVAIKTLNRQHQNSRILQEAQNVSKLQHAHIVQLYEIGMHEDLPYLVYQYFAGVSLKKWLQQGSKVKSLDAVKIICQLLDGLAYAHQQQIVHCDINPANILINDAHVIQIMDFGISEPVGSETSTNNIAGTVNYLAPELLSGKDINPSVDIFSAGLILHEMLSDRMVFTAENSMAVMYKISHEKILPPSKFNSNIDSTLDRITMTALQRELSMRYASATAMLDDLKQYLGQFEESIPEVTTESVKNNSTLEFLIRKMQRRKDFPAVSSHITEINSKSAVDGMSSANELSNVILEDYALTTKLLRLVNSSFYGQFGGEISTVSRAIIILGYEQVRAAAMSIILFEHMKDSKQAQDLKTETYCSLLSAIMAREQAKKMKLPIEDGIETAFVASMFHQLGKLLTIFYFPEEYQEIKTLIDHQGMDTDKAVYATIGITYAELGQGVAKEWKLPDVIGKAMQPLAEGKLKAAGDLDQRIHQLSGFANELCHLGRQECDLEKALEDLAERYEETLQISVEDIQKLIIHSKAELEDFTQILQIDLSTINLFPDPENDPKPDGEESNSDNDRDSLPSSTGENPHDILIKGISDITKTMLSDYDVNQILTMVLETIYRGMGFNRVLFCLRDSKKNQLVARFGYGKAINQIIPKFKISLDKTSNDVVSLSAIKGKEFVILDTTDNRYQQRIPMGLRSLTAPTTLVLYPIVIQKRVLGVVYADMDNQATQLSVEALQYFNTLRNQGALAIQQKQAR